MIKITKRSGIYTLETEQLLPVSLEQGWQFFASPENLEEITPENMRFEITSLPNEGFYEGMLITYYISLFKGLKTPWVTEITHIEKERYFIDEQRFGPYAMWHHEHWFEEQDGGLLARDIVSYKLPVGRLGNFFGRRYVEKKLHEIFGFRRKALEKRYTG